MSFLNFQNMNNEWFFCLLFRTWALVLGLTREVCFKLTTKHVHNRLNLRHVIWIDDLSLSPLKRITDTPYNLTTCHVYCETYLRYDRWFCGKHAQNTSCNKVDSTICLHVIDFRIRHINWRLYMFTTSQVYNALYNLTASNVY